MTRSFHPREICAAFPKVTAAAFSESTAEMFGRMLLASPCAHAAIRSMGILVYTPRRATGHLTLGALKAMRWRRARPAAWGWIAAVGVLVVLSLGIATGLTPVT